MFTFFAYQTSIIARDGKNTDIWTFSVTMFFSIIIAVTIRLCVTQKLFNIFNFISFILLSLILYYAYFWLSNYLSFSKTYLIAEQMHESPIFYLTVILCSGFILVTDLLIETIAVNLMGSPLHYMRRAVNQYNELPDDFERNFDKLMLKKSEKFVREDLKKEESVAKKREVRMKKLQEKIDNNRAQERAKKN